MQIEIMPVVALVFDCKENRNIEKVEDELHDKVMCEPND